MAQRIVLDRHGAAARGCADRAALLRERSRDRPRCRGHLPARGFHLDAGGRSACALTRMEARIGIPEGTLGSLLRADDPSICLGLDRRRAPDPIRILARLVTTGDEIPEVHLYQLGRSPCSCTSIPTPGSIFAAGARRQPRIDWFENSVIATRAHRAFCLSLSREFPGYSAKVWGITASDSQKGYVAWGGPPATCCHRWQRRPRGRCRIADVHA